MRPWLAGLIFILALATSVSVTTIRYNARIEAPLDRIGNFIYYPHTFIKATSLEFSGIVASYTMFKTLIFLGEKLQKELEPSRQDFEATHRALELITHLDPVFLDPYVLAETTLPWDAGMVDETNDLLAIAVDARPFDFRPSFFLWFNYYYFLKDIAAATPHLKKAAQKTNAPGFFKTLTARMSLYTGDIMGGILFLENMLQGSINEQTRKIITTRLEALKKIAYLEHKLAAYQTRFNRRAITLDDLVQSGIVQTIPADPYGGTFYIMENGRVYTTSELTRVK